MAYLTKCPKCEIRDSLNHNLCPKCYLQEQRQEFNDKIELEGINEVLFQIMQDIKKLKDKLGRE